MALSAVRDLLHGGAVKNVFVEIDTLSFFYWEYYENFIFKLNSSMEVARASPIMVIVKQLLTFQLPVLWSKILSIEQLSSLFPFSVKFKSSSSGISLIVLKEQM